MRGLTWSIRDVIAGIEQFVKTTWWQCNKTGHKIWTKETFMQEENSLSFPNYKASLHHLFPGLVKFWIFTFTPFCSMSTKSMLFLKQALLMRKEELLVH